jgi:hypothetical protein
MPAALDVNWEAVRMLAQTIGVREAARRMGISEDAVMQRSKREGWLRDLPRSQPLPQTVLKTVSNVISAPEAAANYLKEVLTQTRTNHAKIALVASSELCKVAEAEPAALLVPETAQTLLTHAKHAALAGSWQSQAPTAKINLSVTGNANVGAVFEAEIVSQDPDVDILADY